MIINAPYSFNKIFKINKNKNLIKWIIECDLEFCKNQNIKPLININPNDFSYYTDYSIR